MINRPKAFKPVKDNLILQKENLFEERSSLMDEITNETDSDKKAKLTLELKAKENELGRVIDKSMRG